MCLKQDCSINRSCVSYVWQQNPQICVLWRIQLWREKTRWKKLRFKDALKRHMKNEGGRSNGEIDGQWSIKALPLSNRIVSRNIRQLTTGGSHQQLMVLNATVARWICSASTLLQHVTVSQSTSPAVDCRCRWNSVSIHDGNLKDFFKYENQPWPPSLLHLGQLRGGQKADLVKCLPSSSAQIATQPVADAVILDGAVDVHMLQPRTACTFD